MDSKKTIGFKIAFRDKPNIFQEYKFSIPPESFSLKQPQRVNRTKTFGGVVEEDYGLDNPIINISGTMAGKRTRQITGTYARTCDGYAEMKILYDHFIKYKQSAGSKLSRYIVYFYDYSQDEETDVYEVSFDDFTLERNADKPHYYNYSMQLFCISHKGRTPNPTGKDVVKPDDIMKAIKKIRDFKDKVAKIVNKIKSANLAIDQVKNQILEILTAANCLTDIVEAVLEVGKNGASIMYTPIQGIQNLIDNYTDLASALIRDTTDVAMTTYATFFDVVQFPARQANKLVKSLLYAKRSFSALEREVTLPEYEALAQNWHELTCACSEVCAYGKRVESRTKFTLENETGDTYEINSLKETPVLPGESVHDVAFRVFGDVNKAWLLLAFNNLDDLQNLPVGLILIVPSNDSSTIEGNPVYDETFSDNYGTDIRSDFAIENNDFVLVRGRDNVMQAISLRLNSKKGSVKRRANYGLANLHNKTIGEVKNEIKEAVLSDIRISDVNDIKVQIDTDLTSYSISIVLKDNVQTTIGGTIK